ncbi:MAG: MaoC family dehydratase [Anderseniella sp.]
MAGKWFEELHVGFELTHELRRTVTEADNMLFSNMTMNPQPLHIDHDFAARSEWGQPLVNSMFTLSLIIGISVQELTMGTLVAQLGITDVKFPAPVFHGDTIQVKTTVVSTRESKSRSDAGIVSFKHEAYKQDGTLVAECVRQAFMRKKPETGTS